MLHSALNAKLLGDKIFQGGPNISENLVPGGPKISSKLKYTIGGLNILIYLDQGELKIGGPVVA